MFHVIRDADSPEFFSVALNLLGKRSPAATTMRRKSTKNRSPLPYSAFLHPDVDAVATGKSLISRVKSPTIPNKVWSVTIHGHLYKSEKILRGLQALENCGLLHRAYFLRIHMAGSVAILVLRIISVAEILECQRQPSLRRGEPKVWILP